MPSPSSPGDGLLLALQTTGGPARVATGGRGRESCVVLGEDPRGACGELPALVARALAAFPGESLARIGVVVGPGSFTGIKVGLAFGRGLARGHGVPLEGLDGHEAMARASGRAHGITAVDALRGQALARAFGEPPPALPEACEGGLVSWESLPEENLVLDPDLCGRRPGGLAREDLILAALALLEEGRGGEPVPVWTRPTWAEETSRGTSPGA